MDPRRSEERARGQFGLPSGRRGRGLEAGAGDDEAGKFFVVENHVVRRHRASLSACKSCVLPPPLFLLRPFTPASGAVGSGYQAL